MEIDEFVSRTGVSRETRGRLVTLAELLIKWQSKINLVSRDSLTDLWGRHLFDSAQLFRLLSAHETRLVDFGSGAGFPGLVLAIMGVHSVHLIESDTRKAAFLREAARVTGAPVVLHNRRIEQVTPFPVDVVTARAVASLDVLLSYTEPYLGRSDHSIRCIFLKGSGVERELTAAQKLWNMRVTRVPSSAEGDGVILVLEDIRRAQRDTRQ
ncbi:MAG: 16S rRNA (guanine(527)-N(7))-methyltransferase RsmG [Alphaproteobacteria bacterium]|nr:16S rRNA (guanine(527)-N(7))-methyltransferase RsmG [Alphaproteobacteria bacterium]